MSEPKEIPRTGCRDACGVSIETEFINQWQRGDITGRYRCPACVRLLDIAAKLAPITETAQ